MDDACSHSETIAPKCLQHHLVSLQQYDFLNCLTGLLLLNVALIQVRPGHHAAACVSGCLHRLNFIVDS